MAGSVRGECDCCGYETALSAYRRPNPNDGDSLLCEVCAGTLLSYAIYYPHQVDDPRLYKSIGYIANMILDAVDPQRAATARGLPDRHGEEDEEEASDGA